MMVGKKFICWSIVPMLYVLGAYADPLLVAVLMVKNEAPVMVDTLKPLVEGGIQDFFIFDTGSTDNTIEVTRDFFDKQHIKSYEIAQEQFINFSTSRNRALDLAEKRFPQAVFMFMPDAEWYLFGGQHLLEFCQEKRNSYEPVYLISITCNGDELDTPRLLRCNTHARFKGRRHETPDKIATIRVPGCHIEYKPTVTGNEKSAQRWHADLIDLLEEYQENPTDPRTLFYLAQTYACLDDLENAYKFYKIRAELGNGWDEENYLAWYRLARITEQLEAIHEKYAWPLAEQYFLQAHNVRPTRAEPLVRIAQRYWDLHNQAAAFLYARRALEIAYPIDDKLFVERHAYDFDRHELISKSAWYVHEDALGENASRIVIDMRPDILQYYGNLKLYFDRKDKNIQ